MTVLKKMCTLFILTQIIFMAGQGFEWLIKNEINKFDVNSNW